MRQKIGVLALVVSACLPSIQSSAQSPEKWKDLLDSGQVFALREAVQHSPAPDLYQGAVLSSCNKVQDATRLLHQVIQKDPHAEAAYQAHDILGNLYQRNGLYKEALHELDAALLERPSAADMRNVRPLFAMLAAAGDMKVTRLRHTRLALAPDDDIPFTINGRPDSFAFDTGANISVMSEREAAHLGLAIKAVSTRFNDSSGNGLSGIHIAVAPEMRIGGLSLRNVPFMVIPDTNEPFVELPPEQGNRGLIGLPILLAMRSIRWVPKSTLEFDLPPTATASPANLLFYEGNPIVKVNVRGRDLDFTLDTGANETDLNPRFAREFPALVASGKKETNKITGMGGSKDYVAVLLPPVALTVGSKTVTLPHPHVSTDQGLGGTTIWAGNLGDDALRQAHAILFDFKNLSLRLE